MAGLIPSLGPGYRTTTGAFKWILLGVAIGCVLLYLVFREAVRESDDIYDKSGFIPRNTNAPAADR
jgi:hypothetical protein